MTKQDLIDHVLASVTVAKGLFAIESVKRAGAEYVVEQLLRGELRECGFGSNIYSYTGVLGVEYRMESSACKHASGGKPYIRVIMFQSGSMCGEMTADHFDNVVLAEVYKQMKTDTSKPKFVPRFTNTQGVMCDPVVQELVRAEIHDVFDGSDCWGYVDVPFHNVSDKYVADNHTTETFNINVYSDEYGAPAGCVNVVVHPARWVTDDNLERIEECLVGRATLSIRYLQSSSSEN